MRNKIASLHYLTQDLPDRSHEEQVITACKAGVKWIQLRVKNAKFAEWLRIARAVREITIEHRVTLIVNDSPEIAFEVNADGVHLGKEDTHWSHARKILGNNSIIGVSTHSLEDVVQVQEADIDYVGLGPFRFTQTKKNPDAVVGLESMQRIVEIMKGQNFVKPIIAIGGIQPDDVHDLIRAGLNGVAVSSAINLSGNPAAMVKLFLTRIEESESPFQIVSKA